MNGMRLVMPECGHTYGVVVENDPETYDKVKGIFLKYNTQWMDERRKLEAENSRVFGLIKKTFLKSDSGAFNPMHKNYLYIEFFGIGGDDEVLELAEVFAKEAGVELQI